MLSKISRAIGGRAAPALMQRNFHQQRGFAIKAAVAGAAGGIGQSLALLMKLDPNIDELACLDVVPHVPGVAVDISHINTPCQVTGGFTDAGNEFIHDVLWRRKKMLEFDP